MCTYSYQITCFELLLDYLDYFVDERSEKRIITRISMSQDFRRKAQVPNLAVIEISQKLEFTNPLMNKKYYPQELGKDNPLLLKKFAV